ncbi:MAG: invasion associated locus B family protein [Croceibacterium sp.]
MFGQWGAFRDPAVPRCYAIAAALSERPEQAGYASVGTWPRRQVRGQVSLRLSRTLAASSAIRLAIGEQRFQLTGGGAKAWAADPRMDAAIVAAMRSARSLSVTATDRAGRRFTDRYRLDGAATALDAATVGCAKVR